MLPPLLNLTPVTLAYVCVSVFALSWYICILNAKSARVKYPPVAHIPASEIFNNPRVAYESALAQHGHIVGVRRKGRLEYIVDDYLIQTILTSDKLFSFEQGTATILNLHYFYSFFGDFFTDMDDMVHNAIVPRMPVIVDQVGPIFVQHAKSLVQKSQSFSVSEASVGFNSDAGDCHPVDIFEHAHKSISEAMLIVIFGQQFVTPQNLAIIERVAADIAALTGIYQNTSIWARTFPRVWRLFIWLRVIFVSVLFGFFRVLGPQIWSELHLRANSQDGSINGKEKYLGTEEDTSVLDYLVGKHASVDNDNGRVTVKSALWIMCLLLGIIFGSVHQTASVVVWVLFELSVRSEYIPMLREEMQACASVDSTTGHPIMSYTALRDARHLDSFIREVLRTKGDTLSTCRKTTQDVQIEGYTIPKGFLIIPMATLAHMNPKYHGPDATQFDGNRWCTSPSVGNCKQAVTLSPSYYPFGLGRWACPGRVLAVTEIKMIVWSIICRSTPRLRGNTYRITDPLNITSVPPEGDMFLDTYDCK